MAMCLFYFLSTVYVYVNALTVSQEIFILFIYWSSFCVSLQTLILKNLQSNILLHLNTAADLFPDGVMISFINNF